jgi:predicted aspartyl protease
MGHLRHVRSALSLLVLAPLAAACGGPSVTPPVAPARPAASAAPAPASDARAVFARYKAATGGAAWDAIKSVATEASVVAGGLTGKASSIAESQTGRIVTHFTLGPIAAANGFDGTHPWDQDPGGEVTAKDAPDAIEVARSEAWLNAVGYFRPDLLGAQASAPREDSDSAGHYLVIEATPAGGRLLRMWFDRDSGLLLRTAMAHEGKTTTTTYSDYRQEGDVRIPFHMAEDSADGAGHVDAREHAETTLTRVAFNPPYDDTTFAVPQMAPGAEISDPTGITRVPFQLLNNHIYVDGKINGKPVHLLVDTGGANILTPAAADRLGIPHEGKLAAGGVGDTQVDMSFARVDEVNVGFAYLPHTVFYVMDLPNWKSLEGTDADGLVGFEMFRRFRVTVDYATHVLTMARADKFVAPSGAHVVPFELAERIPIVTGKLDGIDVRVSVDTGSRSSLTLHEPFAREHDLAKRYGAAPETVTGWGVGGAAKARPARFGTLEVGDLTIKDLAGDISTGKTGAFSTSELSANLGGGILKRFTVTFDYDGRKMYLVPNADFGKPDPFDRSGTWILGDGDAMKIVAIAPGGAAEKAGLKEGDRLVSIGGKPASSKTVGEWRARFRDQAAGTRIPLEVAVEGGKPRKASLTLADAIPEHAHLQ